MPHLRFDAFAAIDAVFLPGDPNPVATPQDGFSDYQVEARTESGWYRGYCLEAALPGASVEEMLDYLMWIGEAACGGPTRSADRAVERFGDTTVARESLECQGEAGVRTRSTVLSGDADHVQIFVFVGKAAAAHASAGIYRVFRGFARDR